jgi:hypothetical protein
MPAVRMIMVWPMARVASTAACWMSSDRFVAFTNRWLMRENTTTETTSTLAGPIAGCRCRVCWIRAPSSWLSRTSPVGSMTAVKV